MPIRAAGRSVRASTLSGSCPLDTTVHGGYSRYFTPPPFELIGSETFGKFAGTTALPPGTVTLDTPPIAERANYYDLGVQQSSSTMP